MRSHPSVSDSDLGEIQAICDDGMHYKTASVCIPASYVRQAKEYGETVWLICTVIGFPMAMTPQKAKCFYDDRRRGEWGRRGGHGH